VVSDLPQRPMRPNCRGTSFHLSPWLCSPQSKTLEELSEIYASAADAQEIAAASSDPVPARERLQSVLRDIAGAASFPAIAGENPPSWPLFPPGFSTRSAPAAAMSSPVLRASETLFCAKFQPSATTTTTKKTPPTQVLFHNHVMSQNLLLILH